MFTSSLHTEFLVIILDCFDNRSCGRLLSEVFERKADYLIITTTSEKIIALLHQKYKKYMKYCAN